MIQRVLQVGKVDFDTAGTDDSDFTFDGVAQPEKVMRAVEQAQHEAVPGRRARTAWATRRPGARRSPPPPPPGA